VTPFLPTVNDRVRLVDPLGPAVDRQGCDYRRYRETGDEAALKLAGEPQRYVFRPPTRRERKAILAELAQAPTAEAQAVVIAAFLLVEVVGPRPLQEEALRALRVSRGGIVAVPYDSPLWDSEELFPGDALRNVGVLAGNLLVQADDAAGKS